jgi:hypothetical protein
MRFEFHHLNPFWTGSPILPCRRVSSIMKGRPNNSVLQAHAVQNGVLAGAGWSLDGIIEVNADWHAKEVAAGITDQNSGGNTVYISPGLRASYGVRSAYVFVNERGQPFGRIGVARMIERAGEAAKLPFPGPCPYAAPQHRLRADRQGHGHPAAAAFPRASITNTVRYTAMSPEPFKDVWR